MSPESIKLLKRLVPDAEPDASGAYPQCAEDDCKSYDGKRCRLTGNRPRGVCDPAMDALGEVIDAAAKAMGA